MNSNHAPAAGLSAVALRKTFGDRTVLDGVDLDVAPGTVLALLGPNGAGKTTMVRILATLLRADGGEARVAGHDVATEPDAVRAAIGVTGQLSAVDDLLTGRENLVLIADLLHLGRHEGRRRVTELLDRLDLSGAADTRVATWSGGMRRRLDLAMTLVGRPRVVFLDEPTTGLDPRSRRALWAIVRELVASGTTILLTTHYLEEADELADRIAVLDAGRIVAQGTAAELKRRVPGGHARLRFADADRLAAAVAALPGATPDDETLTLRVPGDTGPGALRTLLDRLDTLAIDVEELSVHTPDLDDVFLALTGTTRDDREVTSA